MTLHPCSLSLDIVLSVQQTATALRKEYVLHKFQGLYPTLSPSQNFPHCPINITNSNPKQHKLQKPPDQKHFHDTLLKTSTYPSTILFCHSLFTKYTCFEKVCQECFNQILKMVYQYWLLSKLLLHAVHLIYYSELYKSYNYCGRG